MNPNEVYAGFIGFEERSAELYLELSVRFADNEALRWFWVEMAMEEKQHAGMLQHCREDGVFAAELPGNTQIDKLNHVYRQLEAQIAAPDLTLDRAFDIAIRLESSEINDVFNRLTAPIAGPAHVMRKKLELSVVGHFEKLYEAAKRFGVSAATEARLARLVSSDRTPHKRG
jgi:rubrerythrin